MPTIPFDHNFSSQDFLWKQLQKDFRCHKASNINAWIKELFIFYHSWQQKYTSNVSTTIIPFTKKKLNVMSMSLTDNTRDDFII